LQEELEAAKGTAVRGVKQTEGAHAMETAGQDVLQEAAEEFVAEPVALIATGDRSSSRATITTRGRLDTICRRQRFPSLRWIWWVRALRRVKLWRPPIAE
jgi:hypothetical protein